MRHVERGVTPRRRTHWASREGCFRQHMVRKGRNRDTDYLSMLDSEWPQRDAAISALAQRQ